MSDKRELDPDDKRFLFAVLVWIAGVFLLAWTLQQGLGLIGGHVSFWRVFLFSMAYGLWKLCGGVIEKLMED